MCSPSPPEGRSSGGGASTLRRHKTLPGPLRSFPTRRRFQDVQAAVASSTMRLSKSNPYVGWFRHAPPSLRHLTAEAAEWLQKNNFTRNNCCAPFLRRSSSTPFTTTKPCQLLYCYREGEHSFAVYRAWRMHPMMMRDNDYTAGMLLGGTTVGQASDLDGTTKNKNGTNVLSQVAYWLLDASVFIENPPSLQEIDGTTTTKTEKKCPSSTGSCKSADADSTSSDDDDVDEDSDELTIESRDEVGPCANSRRQHQQRPVANNHDDIVDDRLDYNITQMDIVRMNRIASRHLDVESIFSLPTVTYQLPPSSPASSPNKSNSNSSINNNKDDGDNSFSWMLVHSDSEASEAGGEGCGTARLYEGCVICLEGFTTGDRLRILPCKHKFHISCIDKWLSGASSDVYCNTSGCPTCKASPTTIFGNNNNNSESGMAVPGWAFARIGDALIRESQHL
jgi:hypothetical protein